MVIRIGGEVSVARPQAEVFDVRAAPWNGSAVPDPIGARAGTGLRRIATGLAGRAAPVTQLTGCDRPRRLAFRVTSAAADIAGEETFEPVPGGTLVRWSWELRPRGPWRLAGPLLRVCCPRWGRRIWVDLAPSPGRWPPPAGRRGPVPVAEDVYAVPLGRGFPASNVHLVRSGDDWVLIDAGWAGDAAAIRRAAESLFGADTPPAAILLTHIHPDHSAAAGDLARSWSVPVFVHPAELPMAAGRHLPEFDMPLDHWVIMPVMRRLPAAVRSRIEAAGDITDVASALPPAGVVPGLPDWEWVASPGHTPGHVSYLRRQDSVLVSGDAVLTVDANSVSGVLSGRQRLAGPPWYSTWSRPAARRSVAALAALEPRVLAPGHGYPLTVGTTQAMRALADGGGSRVRRTVDRLLVPVGDPRADRYRPPPWLYARLQWLGHALTALGLTPDHVVTLEVPGRRSGRIRRTNLVRAEHDGAEHLVSLTGEAEWVRNARATGGRVVLARRGRRRAVTLVEVPPPDRAPVIRSYVLRAGRSPGTPAVRREARAFFGVGPELDIDAIAAVADRFPTFRVLPDAADPPTDARPDEPVPEEAT